jgi:hypothetical protein
MRTLHMDTDEVGMSEQMLDVCFVSPAPGKRHARVRGHDVGHRNGRMYETDI